ncbi:unnamed protein product [Caenorhabditis brenneri]
MSDLVVSLFPSLPGYNDHECYMLAAIVCLLLFLKVWMSSKIPYNPLQLGLETSYTRLYDWALTNCTTVKRFDLSVPCTPKFNYVPNKSDRLFLWSAPIVCPDSRHNMSNEDLAQIIKEWIRGSDLEFKSREESRPLHAST